MSVVVLPLNSAATALLAHALSYAAVLLAVKISE